MPGQSVIHPPVVQHPGASAAGAGVILGVHGNMDHLHLQHAHEMAMAGSHQQQRAASGHPGGAVPGQADYPYPPPQPTAGALVPPQISPPSVGQSACPPSPYVLPQSNGHALPASALGAPLGIDPASVYNGDGSLSRKRLRSDNGQPVKRLDQSQFVSTTIISLICC